MRTPPLDFLIFDDICQHLQRMDHADAGSIGVSSPRRKNARGVMLYARAATAAASGTDAPSSLPFGLDWGWPPLRMSMPPLK